MLKRENVHFRKTNKNTVVKRVREVYLRQDIPCLSSHCPLTPKCHQRVKVESSLLSADTPYFLVPDYSVALRYVELLEQDELTNIIFTETILQKLQNDDKSRTYKSLRQIAKDPRRRSIVFSNEHCAGINVAREPSESLEHRDWRALVKVAQWYRRHLNRIVPVILLSEQYTQADFPGDDDDAGVSIMSLKEFLIKFWPTTTVLHELLGSLKEAILEEDLATQNQDYLVFKKTAGTGYQEYKPMSELEAGVKSERFFQGVIRVRANHRDQAFIRGNANVGEIVIVGSENRNRAVHGDIVVVELLNKASWIAPSTHISYNPEEIHTTGDDEEEVSNQHLLREVKPTGRVVGVISRNWQPYVATLQEGSEKDSGSFHLVLPLNAIIPKIRIRHHDSKVLANQRIVVRIDSWPITSQYPNGHYVRSLGPIHNLDTEISAILIEHGISVSQSSQGFSEGSLKEMPVNTPKNPWRPEPTELAKRRDLRKHTVFSIDPPNCQDIDDAISIRDLGNGGVEFGVHIADVSYFVKENSLTDLEARARGTTVYLSDRRFDMLPKVLSEQLCSLRHLVDRYAMSVMWTLDVEANVLSTWFGRSVIRSACEMEYEQAQGLLNGQDVVPGIDAKLCKALKPSVVLLAKTMRKVRARRMANGGLELESSEVKFKFKEEDGDISDIVPKKPLEVHQIIEEAMVMANSYVAKRIYVGFRESAMLRHHPPPVENHFKMLLRAAESRGFTIDTSSNFALATSLRECASKSQDDIEFVKLLKTMATMAMSEASYISSGSKSSPIRRYADIVVHRQLISCLLTPEPNDSEKPYVNSSPAPSDQLKNGSKMEQIADHLNYKNRESKLAQKDSTELFQTLYILQKTKKLLQDSNKGDDRHLVDDDDKEDEMPFTETGIISEIRENGFFVFVPRFGIKGPVYLKEKNGDIAVPLSALLTPEVAKAKALARHKNSSQENKDHLTLILGCQMDTDLMTQISVKIPPEVSASYQGLSKMIQLRLFDKVKVALRLRKSHAHRHSIYMTLISLDHDGIATATSSPIRVNVPKANRPLVGINKQQQQKQLQQEIVKKLVEEKSSLTPFTERELVRGIRAGEKEGEQNHKTPKKKKGTSNQTSLEDSEEMYHQTRSDTSLYSLIDAFDRFRIIESSSQSYS
ncbi:DIS3 mitotic control [Podila humilis]|nr:DIS3 mitotic control [Podila humilis]